MAFKATKSESDVMSTLAGITKALVALEGKMEGRFAQILPVMQQVDKHAHLLEESEANQMDFAASINKLEKGKVAEYQAEFEQLSCRIRGWPESALVMMYLGGLRHDIRVEVQSCRPHFILDYFELDLIAEEKLEVMRAYRPFQPIRARPNQRPAQAAPVDNKGKAPANSPSRYVSHPTPPHKVHTQEE
ncbi:unnamed protein product [Victoria cruziana]